MAFSTFTLAPSMVAAFQANMDGRNGDSAAAQNAERALQALYAQFSARNRDFCRGLSLDQRGKPTSTTARVGSRTFSCPRTKPTLPNMLLPGKRGSEFKADICLASSSSNLCRLPCIFEKL